MSKQHRTIIVVLSSAIALALIMRFHLAITRAFDPDEFAYLHWTWLVASGYLPYRDFFFYITPGLQWILSPLLWATGNSINFLIASRVFLFVVYGSCAVLVYQRTKRIIQTKEDLTPLFAVLIFLTFPVTIDKTIDVRPDTVMLALFFGSILVKNAFLSGMLFSLSFLVFPKIVFALPSLVYLQRPNTTWLLGMTFIGLGFLGYLGGHNLISQAITSITKDSFAVTAGKTSFSPLLLFTPYPLIYLTKGGVSLPWLVNTAIWIVALAGLAITMKTNRRMGIFWLLFIGGNILFVVLFPAPYVQYFLPLSVAASVLAGYAFSHVPSFFRLMSYVILLLFLGASFFLQYRERTVPGAENAEQLQVIRDVLAITKANESIYDMVGSYVFRPDGYSICCHPYGEFAHKLTRPPTSLRESLVARQTKFLVMDRVGFVFWKSLDADKTFLLTNYLPMGKPSAPSTPLSKLYSLGLTYRCRQGTCVQYDMDGKTASARSTTALTIIVPENYIVTMEPVTTSITIDSMDVRNKQIVELSSGVHRFNASPMVTQFRLQLYR